MRPQIGELHSGLVGREREVDALNQHRREAAAGRGRLVLVGGDAGIGKSRLLRHLETLLAGGRSSIATARCVEFVQTPLAPVRQLLQGLERTTPGSRDPGMRSLIQRLTFERNASSPAAQPPGLLLESIDAALARHAQRAMVALLIEDLHWADRATLDFFAFLAHRLADRRLLVVATHRGDDLGDHARLGGVAALLAMEHVAALALQPLDDRAVHALVERSLPAPDLLDAATVAGIVRRSRGNPFFAEELLKNALDAGAGTEPDRLPLSIRGAVLARAAQLSSAEREVLSLAAVLGERFAIDRLVALANLPRDDVLRALEHARALDLIDRREPAPGELSFRHALTQEVLYGELLDERIRPLHEAIGLELERHPERDALSVELAHHWWRAGDAARTAKYAELAGDRAFAIGAPVDAISYYERACNAGAAVGSQRASLEHKIGVALGALGRLHSGIARLRRAGELFWDSGDFEGFAKNVSALGALLYNVGETATALELHRHAIEVLSAKLPANSVDLLRARMGYDSVAALDFEGALALVGDIAEPIDDVQVATHTYQTRFKVAAMRGDIERWRQNAARAVDAASRTEEGGYRLYQVRVQIALDAVGLGEVETAREHFAAAVSPELTRYSGNRSLAFVASAAEHAFRGDFSAAGTLLARAETASEQSYAILVHVNAAHLILELAVGDGARPRRSGVDAFLQHGIERGMKLALGLLGGPYAWALGARGDRDEAAAWVRRFSGALPGPHRFAFAFLAAAQFGLASDVAKMRSLLAEAAARPQDRVNKAVLGLFDAFAAQRGLADGDLRARGLDAAARFEAIGWPWFAARAFEAGGRPKQALELYRRIGAARDTRRMEAERSTGAAAVLSRREREVAELAAKGHSNDEIARLLHISPRTVEKHVSSSLDKLQLRSRAQLSQVLTAER